MTGTSSSPQERFGDRALDYARFRPLYPPGIIHTLASRCGLKEGVRVADVGSGTGIFSRLLLETGASVYGVEPNAPMRCAAELDLAVMGRFISVKGSAEATGLADGSVSLVCCAQAFHWFDVDRAKAEFRRILRPGGECALIWNSLSASSAFARGYNRIEEEFGTDYQEVKARRRAADEAIPLFFGRSSWKRLQFANFQLLTYPELYGRLMSCSYIPSPPDSRHPPMVKALEALFEGFQREGVVRMDYDCELTVGALG